MSDIPSEIRFYDDGYMVGNLVLRRRVMLKLDVIFKTFRTSMKHKKLLSILIIIQLLSLFCLFSISNIFFLL